MIVVGFDPGSTTGWAAFDTRKEGDKIAPANMLGYGQEKFLNLIENIEGEDAIRGADVVVIESFQLLPHKAQKMIGNRFEVIQAIGICKSYAKRHKATIVEQPPTIKKIAEKWTGIIPPPNHAQSHWVDAANHAKYWMIRNGLDLSELEKRGGKP